MAPRPKSTFKNKNISKKAPKGRKNKTKIHLVFDETKRREFLTGFHKRKLQRKKEAREKLEKDLKDERKRLKTEAKESYKKLVVSHRPLPELETLLKEEYVDEDVTVKVEELSTQDIAQKNNWIGANTSKYEPKEESESSDNDQEANDEVPGMELTPSKSVVKKSKKEEEPKFDSERDVKKLLKKEATRKVKKSKVFQRKNKIEQLKQKKKSLQAKKVRGKIREKQTKKRH